MTGLDVSHGKSSEKSKELASIDVKLNPMGSFSPVDSAVGRPAFRYAASELSELSELTPL